MHGQRAGDRRALLLSAGEASRVESRLSSRPTLRKSSIASCLGVPDAPSRRTRRGASVMFSITVRCGNRLNLLEHHADLLAQRAERRLGAGAAFSSAAPDAASMPSIRILPRWIGSSAARQRNSVLLPEPLGPITTSTWPVATLRLTSSAPSRPVAFDQAFDDDKGSSIAR